MNDKERGIKTYVIYGMYEGFNPEIFHQYLKDSVDILSYWNHLPLLYFVKTRLSVNDLSAKLRPFFSGTWYIAIEVVPEAANGWLPQPAWEWFLAPAPGQKIPTPPAPPSLFPPGLFNLPKS